MDGEWYTKEEFFKEYGGDVEYYWKQSGEVDEQPEASDKPTHIKFDSEHEDDSESKPKESQTDENDSSEEQAVPMEDVAINGKTYSVPVQLVECFKLYPKEITDETRVTWVYEQYEKQNKEKFKKTSAYKKFKKDYPERKDRESILYGIMTQIQASKGNKSSPKDKKPSKEGPPKTTGYRLFLQSTEVQEAIAKASKAARDANKDFNSELSKN